MMMIERSNGTKPYFSKFDLQYGTVKALAKIDKMDEQIAEQDAKYLQWQKERTQQAFAIADKLAKETKKGKR